MREPLRNNAVMASVAFAVVSGWVALLVTFSLNAPLNGVRAESTLRSASSIENPAPKVGVNAPPSRQVQEPAFTHVRLSRLTGRGLFAGRGEPDARVVLLKGNRTMADALIDSQGKWQIATAISGGAGFHRYTLEQRLAGAERYITGQQIRLFVPDGFRHTVDVTTEPGAPGFSLVAVAAESEDIGSAASRRFDQYLKDESASSVSSGARGDTRQVAERGDLLDPAWRWLENSSRSYHREVVPRIKQRGNEARQSGGREAAQRGEQPVRPRWDDRTNNDVRWPSWPNVGIPEGMSEWFATAKRGYSTEVVPRLKGQAPVVTVARPPPEQERVETDEERRQRLARERALEDGAVAKAERERREAERRRLQAAQERRQAQQEAARLQQEAARLAEQRRKAAEAERKRAEAQRLADDEEARRLAAERKRALERRAEERRRLAEAEREKQAALTRDRDARDKAVARENERLARLERVRAEEARRLREANEARERELARIEAEKQRQRFEEITKQREIAAARRREEEARQQRFSELQRERAAAAQRRRDDEAERERLSRLARERREAAQRRRDAETERARLERARQDERRRAEMNRSSQEKVQIPPVPIKRVIAQVQLPSRLDRSTIRTTSRTVNRSGDRYVFRDTKIEYSQVAKERATPRRATQRAVTRVAKRPASRPVKRAIAHKRKRVETPKSRTRKSRTSSKRTRVLRARLAKARKRRVARTQRQRCSARAGRRIRTPGTYVVRRGDSLWKISRRHYRLGRYFRTIYRANPDKIRKLRLIFPCQRFHLPRRGKL